MHINKTMTIILILIVGLVFQVGIHEETISYEKNDTSDDFEVLTRYVSQLEEQSDSQVTITQGKVSIFAVHNKEYLDMAQVNHLLHQLARKLGFSKGDFNPNLSNHQGIRMSETMIEQNDVRFQIIAQSLPDTPEANHPETHVLVKIETDNQINKLDDYTQNISSLLEKQGKKPEITCSLSGYLSDMLTIQEQKFLLDSIMEQYNINGELGIKQDNLISKRGYTPELKNVILVDGNRQNLNIALRQDDHHGKTAFKIGAPLLTGSY